MEKLDMKKSIGPFDFFSVNLRDYLQEFSKQLKLFLKYPDKIRGWDEIAKKDCGDWTIFFSLLLIIVIIILALLFVEI